MDENWNIKKSLSKKISQDLIDNWYLQAINAGAIGGKLIGAGGGGFLLFLTPLESQNYVMDALNDLERRRIKQTLHYGGIAKNHHSIGRH